MTHSNPTTAKTTDTQKTTAIIKLDATNVVKTTRRTVY